MDAPLTSAENCGPADSSTGSTATGACHEPSPAQWDCLAKQYPRGSLCLVYLLRGDTAAASAQALPALRRAVATVTGTVLWSGRVCMPLNPLPFAWHHALVMQFPSAERCRAFVTGPAHGDIIRKLADVEVHALRMSPGTRCVVALLQWLLPWFAPAAIYSERDIAEECISDVDADAARLQELENDVSTQPVCILNFHRYRQHSRYLESEPEHGEQASGLKAYMRYGRAAVRTVLGRGNRLLVIGRYGLCLIGRGGDPTPDLFDEVTLMQYHSRRELVGSFRLKSMEGRLRHRRAGLERAVMVIVEPDPEFVAPARLPKPTTGA